MEDLKHKFLGFISKQGTKIPSMGFSDETYHTNSAATMSVNSKTISESDRPADQDILESIQAAYFSMDEDFDICKFELSKLPDVLNCDHIEREFKQLKQQHQVVSKKVLQLILQQQTACSDEFQHVVQIKAQLHDTVNVCRLSRRELHNARKQFVTSLGILANYRKRQLVQNLLHSLGTIKTLHCTEDRLQQLLKEENYPGAITLLQECHAASVTYRHFNCVAALTHKLQETLVLAEEQLDQALSHVCYGFDAAAYDKLQQAYRLLGKTKTAIDQLLMHYNSAIYNRALAIVRRHASGDAQDAAKRPYEQLCTLVPQESFIECLAELCRALFAITLSYHQLVAWHCKSADETMATDGDLEDDFNRQYVRQKLEASLNRVWNDVQTKVSTFLMNSDLAWYKFEQFVQVLGVVNRLIQVGDEFCGSRSDRLHDSIRHQSVNYFRNYHAHRLDELRIFLENEIWEVCPVKSRFDVLQLQEFKSLRNVLKNFKLRPPLAGAAVGSPDCGSSNHSQDGSSVGGNYFSRYSCGGTPFDTGLDETLIEEDFMDDSRDETAYVSEDSDDECEELKREFVDDENVDEPPSRVRRERHGSQAPVLTNTTLTVLRQIGKYLQMSRLLRPIAFDIIVCMNQLFDYYLYAVHSFFAADLTVASGSLYSSKLGVTLARINESLTCGPPGQEGQQGQQDHRDKMLRPCLSPVVDLSRADRLFGLAERVVAVESIVFLAKQYESMQGYLEHLVGHTKKVFLQQFYSQTVSCVYELRRPVYMAVIAQAFDLRQILTSMSKVNWEVRDVMSQHSSYVDVLLQEIELFTQRLREVAAKVCIPRDVYNSLWENIAHIVTHTLVEGFAFSKKCSNGGRALMQLDFTQLQSKFEKISELRPMPHREYVEHYVKAYYLPEDELEKWIREHNEYSSKHMLSLVSCAYQNNKKTRQRLTTAIEEMERSTLR